MYSVVSLNTQVRGARKYESLCHLFLQLFVSHLVRMVSVTDQALVSVSLGGLGADAEQVSRYTV